MAIPTTSNPSPNNGVQPGKSPRILFGSASVPDTRRSIDTLIKAMTNPLARIGSSAGFIVVVLLDDSRLGINNAEHRIVHSAASQDIIVISAILRSTAEPLMIIEGDIVEITAKIRIDAVNVIMNPAIHRSLRYVLNPGVTTWMKNKFLPSFSRIPRRESRAISIGA